MIIMKTLRLSTERFEKHINYSCFWALIFTPGPMVEAVTQERMYWPFAEAGFALMMEIGRAHV